MIELAGGVVIAVRRGHCDPVRPGDDRRVVTVDSIPGAVADLTDRCAHHPLAAAVCDDVLRAFDPAAAAFAGVITESLAYSTLQSGPEFACRLAERGPASVPEIRDPVQADRRRRPPERPIQPAAAPQRFLHGRPRRASSVTEVVLSGNGPSFCGGGHLAEFGTFTDPAAAHLAHTRHSPALALDELTGRLGRACRAEVHGRVLGSGLEMAATAAGCAHGPTRCWVGPN